MERETEIRFGSFSLKNTLRYSSHSLVVQSLSHSLAPWYARKSNLATLSNRLICKAAVRVRRSYTTLARETRYEGKRTNKVRGRRERMNEYLVSLRCLVCSSCGMGDRPLLQSCVLSDLGGGQLSMPHFADREKHRCSIHVTPSKGVDC